MYPLGAATPADALVNRPHPGIPLATSRILLIADLSDDALASALETPGHDVSRAADPATAASAGGDPEVIVVDLDGPIGRTVDACRALRETTSLATVPILALGRTSDVEERIALLEAGVDDVLARPFDPRELDARVEALVLRYQRSRDRSGHTGAAMIATRTSTDRRTIVVFSPKGGVGATTVAVNVAVDFARRSPDQVAIVDLDLQFGQVATHLNLPARLSVADLARDEVALSDPGTLGTYMDRHSSGVAVLAAPATPDDGTAITESMVRQLLETVGRAYQVVVVDAGSGLDARSEAVLRAATDVIIVVTPDFPALKAVHALRELLTASGVELGDTTFVLNQIYSREILRLRDVEDALGTKIALTLPYDAFVFLRSVNEGVPVVIGAPRSPAAVQLKRLVDQLAGLQAPEAVAERRSKGLRALLNRS
jgi:pilus assembly protein CpaE